MNGTIQKIKGFLDVRQVSQYVLEQAFLSGCIDIIVVEQPNGSLKSTPFHLRFGQMAGRDCIVDLYVNEILSPVQMRLGRAGEGYFEQQRGLSDASDDGLSDGNVMSEDDAAMYQVDNDKMREVQEMLCDKSTNSKWGWIWGDQPKQTESNSGILQSLRFWKRNKKETKQVESEEDESKEGVLSPRTSDLVEMSICAQQIQQANISKEQKQMIFEQHKVTSVQFAKDPIKIIQHKDLIFRVGEYSYSRDAGISLLLSRILFNQELSIEQLQDKKVNDRSSFFYRLFGKSDKNESKQPTSKAISNLSKSTERSRKISEEIQLNDNTSVRSHQRRRQKKTLKPSSDILKKLGLSYGANKIQFKVRSENRELNGTIFLYNQKSKFVISDIDGTITKSDLMGQLMPKLGTDWNHPGVAQLYQNIRSMGYNLIYLTARAIGQADQTKEFIYNLRQEKNNLPLGPVITSPDQLLPAFKREVIDRMPEVFKIQALKDVRNLFLGPTPFFAGFGNRMTDATAYQVINIDTGRIYIIDTDSNIHSFNKEETTTYVEMNQHLNLYFPSLDENCYQLQNFWKIEPQFDGLDNLIY